MLMQRSLRGKQEDEDREERRRERLRRKLRKRQQQQQQTSRPAAAKGKRKASKDEGITVPNGTVGLIGHEIPGRTRDVTSVALTTPLPAIPKNKGRADNRVGPELEEGEGDNRTHEEAQQHPPRPRRPRRAWRKSCLSNLFCFRRRKKNTNVVTVASAAYAMDENLKVDEVKRPGEEEEAAEAKQENEGLMWKPISIEDHQLEIIRRKINSEKGTSLKNYSDLHRWSVENYAQFWEMLWKHFQIICSSQPDVPVVDESVAMDKIPAWFPGAKLNYAENLLRHKDDHKIAFYYTSERIKEVGVRSKTFGQLRSRVAFIARALKEFGVSQGDRVVGYLPNFPESIELMAAVASLGAIWSSTSPDFGVSGVLDRFKQIRPKIIFSVESVSYNMKIHDHLGKLKEVAEGLPDLEKVVVIPYCKKEEEISLDRLEMGDKACFFSKFVGSEEGECPPIEYVQVPFNHPLFIMYSSGTTGAPKCIVHGVGGTLMKHLEEHRIQGNRSEDDVLLYYTTIGWMMWNWMVSALALGTTLVLYDGSPLLPHPAALWDLVDKLGITIFGTSAKWIAVQEDKGVKPGKTHKLNSLKAICSTGSPLSPRSYDYVYRDIKSNVLLASITGGTDIIACFMGENSTLPVHRGQIQSAHLGCAIECWDEDGRSNEGQSGELVCAKPFPSMPVSFWNDPEGSLYHSAYFAKFEGVWAHGDFLVIDPKTKGFTMLGRSDGTLNPNGVRFGSAEIYSIIEASFADEVTDSLCIGQGSPVNDEERVILFLKMCEGKELNEDLIGRVRSLIRSRLSARHVPALILPTKDIPYTVNGKKVEVAVKKIIAKQAVKNASALANPESLDLYKDIPEVGKW